MCEEEWDDEGDDRWVICYHCDQAFHLQCSGIPCIAKDYYSVDVQSMKFVCATCQ